MIVEFTKRDTLLTNVITGQGENVFFLSEIFVGILHMAEPRQARAVLLLSVSIYLVYRG